jgi:hypothetical protein
MDEFAGITTSDYTVNVEEKKSAAIRKVLRSEVRGLKPDV